MRWNCEQHEEHEDKCFQCRILRSTSDLKRPLTAGELASLWSSVHQIPQEVLPGCICDDTEAILAGKHCSAHRVEGLAKNAVPCPTGAREMWLLTPLGSMGRRQIQVEQYEELRSLAIHLKLKVAELTPAPCAVHGNGPLNPDRDADCPICARILVVTKPCEDCGVPVRDQHYEDYKGAWT